MLGPVVLLFVIVAWAKEGGERGGKAKRFRSSYTPSENTPVLEATKQVRGEGGRRCRGTFTGTSCTANTSSCP